MIKETKLDFRSLLFAIFVLIANCLIHFIAKGTIFLDCKDRLTFVYVLKLCPYQEKKLVVAATFAMLHLSAWKLC